jgi:hypothetical protein
MAGSVATIILGLALAGPAPSAGALVTVAGIVSLTVFLLYVWRVATTSNDQWVWQTPHKPRRELRAEAARRRESASRQDESASTRDDT